MRESLQTLTRLGLQMERKHPAARTRSAIALLSSVDRPDGPWRAAHTALERVEAMSIREMLEYASELRDVESAPLSVRILAEETFPGSRPAPLSGASK